MPELPEVEEVRRTLEPYVLNVRIAAVAVHREDFVMPGAAALRNLAGRKIVRTLRHGKKLFLVADDDQTMLIHLGMSGRVDCVPSKDALAKHTHVVLQLDTGTEIRFCDPRRFGGIWHYPSFEAAHIKEIKGLGVDALQLTIADFASWKDSRSTLKQRLLSQRDVAGLGNIYIDEALWLAKIHPLQQINRIRKDSLAALVDAIHRVLNQSLAMGGTTLRDYRNAGNQPGRFKRKLKAYGRGGKPCLRCGKLLKFTRVAARATVFCSSCQRAR